MILSALTGRTRPVNTALPRTLWVASYPPRACGIATFTEDVRGAYDQVAGRPSPVVAVTDEGRSYRYPDEVIAELQRDDWHSYARAADAANAAPIDVVNVQHEYGLFGGDHGEMLVEFLTRVRKPIVTTLHTVLPDPDRLLRAVTREVCIRSDRVLVMSSAAKSLLVRDYELDARSIRVAPHGAPDVRLRSTFRYKRRLGLAGRTVIGTFGLIGRGKGIEYVIDALPDVLAAVPDAIYLLCGQTHPHVRRWEGEAYRDSLRARATVLGVADRVRFIDHYLTDEEVVECLLAMDAYVSPSLDPNQAVSGTLSYAVACGRPVIATAYAYARELLGEGRGITIPFRDSRALADATVSVLTTGRLRRRLARNAYRYGRAMMWTAVAHAYEAAFVDAVLATRPVAPRRAAPAMRPLAMPASQGSA